MSYRGDLERLLVALYFKEIDQEENVWRSLTFFSATLALEAAALLQVVAIAGQVSLAWKAGLLGGAGLVVLTVIGVLIFLYRAIREQPFSYIASGEGLLAYVQDLEADEREDDPAARERTRAGIFLLASVLTTIALVAAILVHKVRLGS